MAAPCSDTTYSFTYVNGQPVASKTTADRLFQNHKVKFWTQRPTLSRSKGKGIGQGPKDKLLKGRCTQTSSQPSCLGVSHSSKVSSSTSKKPADDSTSCQKQADGDAWQRKDMRRSVKAGSRKSLDDVRQQAREDTKQQRSQARQKAGESRRKMAPDIEQRTYHAGLGEGLARSSRYEMNLKQYTVSEIYDRELDCVVEGARRKIRYEGHLFSLHHGIHNKSVNNYDLRNQSQFMAGFTASMRLATLTRYRREVEVIEKAQDSIDRCFCEQVEKLGGDSVEGLKQRFEIEKAHYLNAFEDLHLRGIGMKTSYESLLQSSCGPFVGRLETIQAETIGNIKRASIQFRTKLAGIKSHLDNMIDAARKEPKQERPFYGFGNGRFEGRSGSKFGSGSSRHGYSAPESRGLTRSMAYELLGLKPGASKKEIGRAYRQKALKVHPDKNPGISDQVFKNLSAAYELVK